MNIRLFLAVVGSAMIAAAGANAQETPKRANWDQKKAVEIVKKIVALEEAGTPWDKIAWKTDVAEAIKLAEKEQKPIFVFFFLKKNVGPVGAPC